MEVKLNMQLQQLRYSSCLLSATLTASSVLVLTLLACPWSGNTAASMKVREGDKDIAPTVMHFRQVRAAKLSSLPPNTSW